MYINCSDRYDQSLYTSTKKICNFLCRKVLVGKKKLLNEKRKKFQLIIIRQLPAMCKSEKFIKSRNIYKLLN